MNGEEQVQQRASLDALFWRVGELEKDMGAVTKKLDRLLWALVTLTVTLAGWTISMLIFLLSLGERL